MTIKELSDFCGKNKSTIGRWIQKASCKQETFLPKLPEYCADILQDCPDGLALDDLCTYVRNNPSCKDSVLVNLISFWQLFSDATIAIIQNKNIPDIHHQNLNDTCKESFFSDERKKQNSKKKNGFVYIAKQLNEDNLYKIGCTNNISKRTGTFKTGNCFVEIVASKRVEDKYYSEHWFHQYFNSKHYKNEWYKLSDEDIEMLLKIFDFNLYLQHHS